MVHRTSQMTRCGEVLVLLVAMAGVEHHQALFVITLIDTILNIV